MRTKKMFICQECKIPFETTEYRQKFCSQHCAGVSSNKNRLPPSENTRKKQSESLKKYYLDHPEKTNPVKRKYGPQYSQMVGSFTKNKFGGRGIKSILSVSKRTASKILKRLNLGCSCCGWKEGSCDIHHINGRKIENPDNHENLTLLCPNHHRLFHEKKISKENVISLDKYFPENWRDVYYG